MKAILEFLLLCLFLHASALTAADKNSYSELFSDVKMAVASEGQSNSVDNLSCEPSDCDFLTFSFTFPPLSLSDFNNRLWQLQLASHDVSSNLIRAPPQ
ncbi:hypothetical protein [Litorilituus sediminis]|uniref:DUF2946 domain-containing protein n=1 Tax=Litorilituus sediminis TaxID=718192 RepID=A0A4P6P5H8_9GAMM|nr:hypothetical protein [Litorilituus sediminis]QBG36821.1 hypothetical protein EMK97_14380 [Litorilituus sediminis]